VTTALIILAVAVLAFGGVGAAFLAILAVSIHRDHSSRHLAKIPGTHTEAMARRVLGLTVRNDSARANHSESGGKHVNA
jgi:hypothetical protein